MLFLLHLNLGVLEATIGDIESFLGEILLVQFGFGEAVDKYTTLWSILSSNKLS